MIIMKSMYQTIKGNREKYRDCEIEVDPIYKEHTTNRVYPKGCFDKSWDYISMKIHLPEVKLIHGSCLAIDRIRIHHAWIEIGPDIVFESVFQRFYDREKYYAARNLIKHFEYDFGETMKWSLEYKHKGPWQFPEQRSCFDFIL